MVDMHPSDIFDLKPTVFWTSLGDQPFRVGDKTPTPTNIALVMIM